jgi:hypothetical protein
MEESTGECESNNPLTAAEEKAMGTLLEAVAAHASAQNLAATNQDPFDVYSCWLELRFFGDPVQLRTQGLRGYRTLLKQLDAPAAEDAP